MSAELQITIRCTECGEVERYEYILDSGLWKDFNHFVEWALRLFEHDHRC